MICLGIESTAHTFGIGIIDSEGNVLADERSMFIPEKGWGIKPIEAVKHHETVKEKFLEKALKQSKLGLENMDMIAFSQGPGLPPCLRVGKDFALSLSKETVPVNHCVAHLEIARLFSKAEDPVYVYVSGGNTQVISMNNSKYRVFGETQDIGMGNALDKFGREAGMEFPSGPKIEKLAEKGKYIELPYVVKGMDLSFSGILTSALQKLEKAPLEDICFSLQETFFSMLTEVTERALAHLNKKEVLIIGGVAANSRLHEMMETMCKERGSRLLIYPKEYAGDNGVNIAWTGLLVNKKTSNPDIKPRQRADEVDVSWV
jgi:N6-L-threonylcarbamoyladenine synthase/protein kinase Bud32